MPEGPEIRRAADQIARVLEDHIVQVGFGMPDLKHYEQILSGHAVTHIETRGKALLLHFDHGWSVFTHNQLYGVWRVIKGDVVPATRRSLRLAVRTDSHSALLFSASNISVWRRESLEEHPFLARIGPDILDPTVTWRQLSQRLASKPFANRSLIALYLDQAYIAGLGNYLRSEILFDAAINPWLKPKDLSITQRNCLARCTLNLSQRSYKTGGITNPPDRVKQLKSQGLPRSWHRFAIFDREGLPCYHCGNDIIRSEAGSRRLYWCPHCQAA